MKRLFDVVLAVAGLVLLGPGMLLIAGAIWATDGRPIFFRQQRIGRYGVPFRIWKFRTMVTDAASLGSELTVGQDRRITRAGKILRKYKLDELPQLFNVLLGEMSFVGPRPEVPYYVDKYTPEQRRVLQLTPGITDVASIRFRDESEHLSAYPDPEAAYVDKVLPEKIRLNLAYASRANLVRDAGVILQTLVRIST